MTLPFAPPLGPMLARGADQIPAGDGWLYEPKWDGFRTLVYRDGEDLHLESRNGQPMQRYFPELLVALREAIPERCVLDGEIVVATARGLDFDVLQQRIHPAGSRVARLSVETPASFVAFDLLAEGERDLRGEPFAERCRALAGAVRVSTSVLLTPQTADPEVARDWFTRFEGAGLDGVVAKRAELPYRPGERVMVKVKHRRTADCVVGGYRVGVRGEWPASLLLGLYDEGGVLHYVGHTSSFGAAERREIAARLEPLRGGTSFVGGRAPGGISRWSRGGRDASWETVTPSLVCEISFDQMQSSRFRHAARLLRWRHDKPPEQCDTSQLEPPRPFELSEIIALRRGA